MRVAEKVNVTDAEIEQGRDQLRDELVNQRRDKFFGAYMQKAKPGCEQYPPDPARTPPSADRAITGSPT